MLKTSEFDFISNILQPRSEEGRSMGESTISQLSSMQGCRARALVENLESDGTRPASPPWLPGDWQHDLLSLRPDSQ